MIHGVLEQRTLDAAVVDAGLATMEFDGARAWLERVRQAPMEPLAAEVWATDLSFSSVLLVCHRWRGWVTPGGRVEGELGETPREAAAREFLEETGVPCELVPVPAAAYLRSYRSDWTPTLGISYGAVVDRSLPLSGEAGQPAAWVPLDEDWDGAFPEDRDRIRRYVRALALERSVSNR